MKYEEMSEIEKCRILTWKFITELGISEDNTRDRWTDREVKALLTDLYIYVFGQIFEKEDKK